METLKELKLIIENAPEGATHFDGLATWKYKNLDRGTFLMPDGTGYKIDEFYPNETIRSLSDIKRIIELMESNSKLQNKSGESFKEELLKATTTMIHPHIEGVYAVWEKQL